MKVLIYKPEKMTSENEGIFKRATQAHRNISINVHIKRGNPSESQAPNLKG